ncbi:MAG: transposase [Dehalococcoidia bacterium]|nr:transposase [Dehalococcoidia bacterium]
MTLEKMNTENMSRFLNQVHQNHLEDFMIMVLDDASSHRGKELIVPENISLVFMPPYSPEFNPSEQIWNRLRKNYFANKVFHSLDAVTQQAEQGLFEMASDKNAVMSLTYWPWIKSIDLTAN